MAHDRDQLLVGIGTSKEFYVVWESEQPSPGEPRQSPLFNIEGAFCRFAWKVEIVPDGENIWKLSVLLDHLTGTQLPLLCATTWLCRGAHDLKVLDRDKLIWDSPIWCESENTIEEKAEKYGLGETFKFIFGFRRPIRSIFDVMNHIKLG